MHVRSTLALASLIAVSACNGSGGSAQAAADSATKAIYADDVSAVTAGFDTTLQHQVTRAGVGLLSDKMHALGAYKGLTFVSADPAKSVFYYRADFTNGSMNVAVKTDSNGQLAAYRVFPNGM